MKILQAITFLLFFVTKITAQSFAPHTLVDCKKEACYKKHKMVTVDYDSLSGLKIIMTTYSSGKNLNAFGGLTPEKSKSIQEVVLGNGKRLKKSSSVNKFRGDAARGPGSYISFNGQRPGFYVCHTSKLFRTGYIKRYDALGNFIEKK